jgi:thymidylate synthase ThyX
MNIDPKVVVIDDMHPEDVAMLQALYSRSPEGVEAHREKVMASGSGRFMERFYVGYGHKSIGDCGSTTLFFEGVSILAAKAIQDNPLYSGQETSTRYLDFSSRAIIDPVGTPESKAILDRWMGFYRTAQEPTAAEVRRRHPRRDGEDEKAYEGAVKARTFDVLRGFLPAGMTTQLSWHTNLRQAADGIDRLGSHPLEEVNWLAHVVRERLRERYRISFGEALSMLSGVKQGDLVGLEIGRRTEWEADAAATLAYDGLRSQLRSDEFGTTIDNRNLEPFARLLRDRPRGCVLPHVLSALGQVTFDFLLDYGSWRDIQRQRNGVCAPPLLTTCHGFEPWYLAQLDNETRASSEALLEEQHEDIAELPCTDEERQYYVALGFRVPTVLCYGLPAAVYVMELRSGKTIHPTLRRAVHRMIQLFEAEHPLVRLHVDREPDDWTVRRGTQTITEKQRPRACENCGGSGAVYADVGRGDEAFECIVCKGAGRVPS